jgi:hypothetical protein
MSKSIDHKYTQEIVCPYCGCEWIDSWEEGNHGGEEDIGLLECPDCERTFNTTRQIDITYSTERYGTCEKCGKEKVTLDEAPFIFDGFVCRQCWSEDYDEFNSRSDEE